MSTPRRGTTEDLRLLGTVCLIAGLMFVNVGGGVQRTLDAEFGTAVWFYKYGVILALTWLGYVLLKKWKRLP